MPSNLDIYRSAKLLIDQHGEYARLEADMRADAMLKKGDMKGATTWRRIVKAVEELYWYADRRRRRQGRLRRADTLRRSRTPRAEMPGAGVIGVA